MVLACVSIHNENKCIHRIGASYGKVLLLKWFSEQVRKVCGKFKAAYA